MLTSTLNMDLIQQFPQAKTFAIQGKNEAVLMIHGFTSTPDTFRALAEFLHQKTQWHIRAPLLPGHGLTYKQLDDASCEQWIQFVEEELLQLTTQFSRIHLIGISMGATLCAHLATRFAQHTTSLTLLSPGLYFRRFLQRLFLPLVRIFPEWIVRNWHIHKPHSISTQKISYQQYSVKSVLEVDRVARLVRSTFDVFAPCLIIFPRKDKTIHPKSARWFYDHIHHPYKKCIELTQSPHIIFMGNENEKIFSEILQFLDSTR